MSYQEEFINKVKDGAIEGWKKHKILPSVSIAQAILESNWGRSKLAKEANNLFGIKGDYNGESMTVTTKEWDGSKMIDVDAGFRKYPSWNESIEDHGTFFTSTEWRKNNYRNVIGETDYAEMAKALSDSGYATDPAYATKLINIVGEYDLSKYDMEAFSKDESMQDVEEGYFILDGEKFKVEEIESEEGHFYLDGEKFKVEEISDKEDK